MKDKKSFDLQELSEIIGVGTHVIRYWETEFPQIKSEKIGPGQRIYSRKDLDVITRIRYLLFEESYTIANTKIELAKEFD